MKWNTLSPLLLLVACQPMNESENEQESNLSSWNTICTQNTGEWPAENCDVELPGLCGNGACEDGDAEDCPEDCSIVDSGFDVPVMTSNGDDLAFVARVQAILDETGPEEIVDLGLDQILQPLDGPVPEMGQPTALVDTAIGALPVPGAGAAALVPPAAGGRRMRFAHESVAAQELQVGLLEKDSTVAGATSVLNFQARLVAAGLRAGLTGTRTTSGIGWNRVLVHSSDSKEVATALLLKHLKIVEAVPKTATTLPSGVRLTGIPVDTIWVRDYGSLSVHQAAHRGWLTPNDFKYDPARGRNQAVPKKLGLTGEPYTQAINHELVLHGGGFLMANYAKGTCLVSAAAFKDWNEGRYSADFIRNVKAIERVLASSLGCKSIIAFAGLPDEGTGHIDMMLATVRDGLVLLSEPHDVKTDRVLGAHLDAVRKELVARGIEVERLKMPPPRSKGGERVWETYTNGLVLNGPKRQSVLVPMYGHRESNNRAIATYRRLFPGATIVAIPAGKVIEIGGAVHCATMQTSTRPPAAL